MKIISILIVFILGYFCYCAIFGLFFSFLSSDFFVFVEAIRIFKKVDDFGIGFIRALSASFSIIGTGFLFSE